MTRRNLFASLASLLLGRFAPRPRGTPIWVVPESATVRYIEQSARAGGGAHIQRWEIVVRSNQDPSRIARLMAEKQPDT